MAYVYMVLCEDNSIYTGIAQDVKKRMSEHLSGNGAKYTKSHKVKEILALWKTDTLQNAAKLEYRIKQLERQRKEWLIANKGAVRELFDGLEGVVFEAVENVSLKNLP